MNSNHFILPIRWSFAHTHKISVQSDEVDFLLGIGLQIKVFAQWKEMNSHAKILYEEHVKNRSYLKLNWKNKKHLLWYLWPFLALGKNLFAFPRTCYLLFKNMKNDFFFLEEHKEQILLSSWTRKTNTSFFQNIKNTKNKFFFSSRTQRTWGIETCRSSHQWLIITKRV